MNRKLVNGLLLLSIATVGCGTFTSCKDTDEDVKAEYNKELASVYKDLLDQIEAAKCKCPANLASNLDAIANWLNATKDQNGNYVLPEGGIDTYFVEKLTDALKTGDYAQIVPALQDLQGQMNKQITSIELNQTYNPVFGTLNLPTGLQTNVLAAYYGTSDKAFKFPDFSDEMSGHEVGLPEAEMLKVNALWTAANLNPATVAIPAGVYMDQDGFLGNAYLTINPINNGLAYDLELIKSTGEVSPVKLATATSDDELKFVYSRANNGLYKAVATINPEDASKIAIALKPEFKSAVKNILKDPGKATITKLGTALLDQMNGILPAYGFRAPFDAASYSFGLDEEGNYTIVKEENPLMNAIVSKYELAATTIHPLGYNSLSDITISKRLPTFDPLTEVIHNLFADVKKQINFTLDIKKLEPLNIKFEISEFSVDNQFLKITIPSIQVGNDHSDPIDIYLTYNKDNGTIEGIPAGAEVQNNALKPLIDSITESVNKLLVGDGVDDSDATKASIQYQVTHNIVGQVNSMINEINDMLVGNEDTGKPGISGQINNQLGQILDNIENQISGKIGPAQKLLDIYNKLAEKVNAYIADPHGHMQVAMAYEDANGAPHMLSTNPDVPSYFSVKGGNAIQLFATSYTADVAAPSYKKYVAVVASSNNDVAKVNEASKYLNTVISGRQHIIDMAGFSKGNYTIVYSSVDYRGNTSTRLYYLTVGD